MSSKMFRSRSLLVLFRERRTILAAHRQIPRSGALKCQKIPRRQLSDSVKVLSHRDEIEEKEEKNVTPSKDKLFSLDDIFEGKEKDIIPEEVKFALDDSDRKKKNEKKLKDGNQSDNKSLDTHLHDKDIEIDISKIKSSQEHQTEEIPVVLKEDQEQSKEIDVESIVETVVIEESVNVEKYEKFTPQREQQYIMHETKKVNLITVQHELANILIAYVNKNINVTIKNALIVCVLKRLEKLDVLDVSEEVMKALQSHLDHNSQITRVNLPDLLNILNFFMKGSREDNKLTFTILHELCWRLRKSSLSATLSVLESLKQRQTTEKRREVNEMGKKRLIENIGNVSSPQELLSAMYLLLGNKEAQLPLEEEASIMLKSMDTVQTYRLIYLLALNKSKNFSLVTNARKQLCSRPIFLDIIKMKNLFFACEVLRIHDPNLLHEMSVNFLDLFENKCNSDRSAVCLSVLLSCSKIGWNFKKMTETIVKELIENTADFLKNPRITVFQLASLVMSIGHLNLVEHGDLGLNIAEHLMANNQIRHGNLLNVVHSLACIQKAKKENVIQLLHPTYYQPLLDSMKEKPEFLQDNIKRKLLTLYGYIKEDLHSTVPDIESKASEWRDQLQEKMKPAPLAGLAKVVSEVLTEIAPLEKYTNTNIVTKYGYTIDFEIFLDEKHKAVRLDNTTGTKKVWIKMLDYSSFIHGGTEPEYCGETAMMLRHLKSEQDVAIVYVPYSDWSKHDKKLDHLIYLETKIKSAVEPAEDTATSDNPK